MKKKKVVVVGGGNGSALVLDALKKRADELEISAVISVSDSGASSGALRRQFNTLPPGDILRAVLALSSYDYAILKNIFYKNRFSHLKTFGTVEPGHGPNLGNLFLTLLARQEGGYVAAIQALEEAVEARGQVFPATLEQAHLAVELSNGQVLKEEAAIDRPTYDRALVIKRAWLEPEVAAYSGAMKALKEADHIIIGPGSLYTSLIPALLPVGIQEAIKKSKAHFMYITACSYEGMGETGPGMLSGFVKDLQKYVPRHIDTVLYNCYEPTEAERKKYEEKQWLIFPKDVENLSDYHVVGFDYEEPVNGYNPAKLSNVLTELIK